MNAANETTAALVALIDRLHTACLTVEAMPKAGPRGIYTTWPLFKLDWFDLEDYGEQRMSANVVARFIQPPRFYPTAKQIDDALPALALLDGFEPPRSIGGDLKKARRVIRHRAIQVWVGDRKADEEFAHYRGGWRGVGRLARCSHTTARNLHREAMHYALARSINPDAINGRPLSKSVA